LRGSWILTGCGYGAGAPSDLPFGELSNLLMTPHSSGVTRDIGRVDDIAANIARCSVASRCGTSSLACARRTFLTARQFPEISSGKERSRIS
jgi:hypothetical protein